MEHRILLRASGWVAFALSVVAWSAGGGLAAEPVRSARSASKPSLKEALAALKTPPPWFERTAVSWDTARPWKEGRIEIRRLLALGTQAGNRQAVKLTWLYRQKKDIGNGHEYPMYLFLAGEIAWATPAYEEYLRAHPERGTHAYLDLASCYRHFGEYGKAAETLQRAMANVPTDAWRVSCEANVHDGWGDLLAEKGDKKQAREHYAKAVALYPQSKQPYGRHLLARRAAKVQAKLDMLEMASLRPGDLAAGRYAGTSLGYTGPLSVTATVRSGRIADLQVQHKEKIHQNAPTIIPRRIIQAQSLKVDAITGATVTSQAIVDATFQALKKARRK